MFCGCKKSPVCLDKRCLKPGFDRVYIWYIIGAPVNMFKNIIVMGVIQTKYTSYVVNFRRTPKFRKFLEWESWNKKLKLDCVSKHHADVNTDKLVMWR